MSGDATKAPSKADKAPGSINVVSENVPGDIPSGLHTTISSYATTLPEVEYARSSRNSDDPRTPPGCFPGALGDGPVPAGLPPHFLVVYRGTEKRHTVTGLKPGQRCSFVLRQYNAHGPSECCAPVQCVVDTGIPEAPADVEALHVDCSRVVL